MWRYAIVLEARHGPRLSARLRRGSPLCEEAPAHCSHPVRVGGSCLGDPVVHESVQGATTVVLLGEHRNAMLDRS